MSAYSEISSQPQPQSSLGRHWATGIVLLAVTAVWAGLLAKRGLEQGLPGKDLWMLGVVAVCGLASLHQLRPSRGSTWLVTSALGLLTILLFVSGASQGGSFLMWTAGSATFFSPILLWAFEPDAEAVEVTTDTSFAHDADEDADEQSGAFAAAA